MTIHLDHAIVPARDAAAAARQLAELLDVPWGVAAAGPFVALYLNEGLTLDFISTDEAFPVDHRVGTHGGGRNVYWNEPDGHQWEMLTVSYARQP